MRRKKSNGTWFPTLGSVGPGADVADTDTGIDFSVDAPGNGTSNITIFPITFDSPQEVDSPNVNEASGLNDIIGNEYIVKRILGNCFVSRAANEADIVATTIKQAVKVTCAFFVARAEDETHSGGVDEPIGSALLGDAIQEYGPTNADNIREPWMWRKTWLLGWSSTPRFPTQTVSVSTQQFSLNFPACNAYYASLIGGPHVDVKSRRRVRQDERLWFVAQARNWPLNSANDGEVANETPVRGHLDVRMFGSLVKARNKSSF